MELGDTGVTVRQDGLTAPVQFVKSVSSDYAPVLKFIIQTARRKDLKKSKTGWLIEVIVGSFGPL